MVNGRTAAAARNRISVFILASLVILSSIVPFSSSAAQKEDSTASLITKLDDSLYQLGTIRINSGSRELTIPGRVNMQKGLVELLACGKSGKVHESILVLDVIPYHMHVALMLIGLNFGGGLEYQGDPRTPTGDSVDVWVRWTMGDQATLVRAEDLVWDVTSKASMTHTPWVFVGSKFAEGRYLADIDQSLITTYHDPLTILDNLLVGGGNDELYYANEALVPPVGTSVEVVIRSLKR